MLMTPRGQPLFNRLDDSPDNADDSPASGRGRRRLAASDPGDAALADLQLEVALYIERVSAELRLMARAANLEALSYFIEMARIEASIQIEKRALALSE